MFVEVLTRRGEQRRKKVGELNKDEECDVMCYLALVLAPHASMDTSFVHVMALLEVTITQLGSGKCALMASGGSSKLLDGTSKANHFVTRVGMAAAVVTGTTCVA